MVRVVHFQNFFQNFDNIWQAVDAKFEFFSEKIELILWNYTKLWNLQQVENNPIL